MTQTPFRNPSLRARKARGAEAARRRLPIVWLVAAGTIAVVFVVVFALAALL